MNIIKANFKNRYTSIVVASRYQWDYGQVLQFEGLDLPAAFEVNFSNRKDFGEAITRVGTPTDGVTIPDELFTTGKTIYAYVYLHNTTDDGRTKYKVTIPVNRRAKPIDVEIEPEKQSTVDDAIAAFQAAGNDLRETVEKADIASRTYPKVIDGNWYVWDVDGEVYVDTGVRATGDDGAGIHSIVSNPNGTLTITLDNGESVTTTPLKGDKGDKGDKGEPGGNLGDVIVDTSLSISGAAADAKATGRIKTNVDGVTESYGNFLYAYDWVTDGATIEFSGDDIILTATDSTKPAMAYVDIPCRGVVVSYESKSSTSTNDTAASIQYGYTRAADGKVIYGRYITNNPFAFVINEDLLRIALYVDRVAVAEGTTATFTKLQVEKPSGTPPRPTEFTRTGLTATDYIARGEIESLKETIVNLENRIAELEN